MRGNKNERAVSATEVESHTLTARSASQRLEQPHDPVAHLGGG